MFAREVLTHWPVVLRWSGVSQPGVLSSESLHAWRATHAQTILVR